MLGKSSGKAYVFRGVDQLAHNQTLIEPQNEITFISLVGDFLAISENGCCVYIYRDDGSTFSRIQTINLSSAMPRKATLAKNKKKKNEDDIYLTISSPDDSSIKIYEYENS